MRASMGLSVQRPLNCRAACVSPVWVKETLIALGMDPAAGMPAGDVAPAYAESVEGRRNGEVLDTRSFVK
jgi:hypothetical protein